MSDSNPGSFFGPATARLARLPLQRTPTPRQAAEAIDTFSTTRAVGCAISLRLRMIKPFILSSPSRRLIPADIWTKNVLYPEILACISFSALSHLGPRA